MSPQKLAAENRNYFGTGGRSQENASAALRPAFLDVATGTIHPSRFGDGKAAPIHVLEGLPKELVVARSAEGRVAQVRDTVISGFVRLGQFYTRQQASDLIRILAQ